MSLGYKLKNIRIFRNMTQRELGLAVGFNSKTADIRIAQYESGTRVPKEKIAYAMAKALNVHPDYLMAPSPFTYQEIMHALINIDELNVIEMEAEERTNAMDEPTRNIKISLPYMNTFFAEWYDKKEAFNKGEITREEYYEWKIKWPDTSPAYRSTFPELYEEE